MIKTIATAAALLASLAAHSTFAADKPAEARTPTAATCKSLETQYESAAKTHSSAARFKQAEAAYADGKKLCDEGKYAKGSTRLHTALKDLGVKATSNTH